MDTTVKVNDFLCNFLLRDYRYNYEQVVLNEEIDELNLDANKLLRLFHAECNKDLSNWDWEYISKQRRGLKKLVKLVKSARIEKINVLVSMFLNIETVREKIISKVIDGKKMEDFSCNPYDFDYGIYPDDIQKSLIEAMEYFCGEKKPEQPICSVSTFDAGKPLVCLNCEGNGFFVCKKCNGSGHEQRGNMTVLCKKCTSGKIQCKTCKGTGKGSEKYEFLSDQYQIIKSFDDSKNIRGCICKTEYWSDKDKIYLSDWDFPNSIHNFNSSHIKETLRASLGAYKDFGDAKNFNEWLSFGNDELESGITILYKNQKEIAINDENQNFPIELESLYEQNKRQSQKFFKEYEEKTQQGKWACAVEKHYAIPIYCIHFMTGLSEYESQIYMISNDGKTHCFFDMINGLPELGFFKSLFV